MGDLVDIQSLRARRRRFRKGVHLAAHRLREFEAEVMELAVGLAMEGPLAAWSDAQPIGTTANIDEEALEATQDPHVIALVQACRQLYASVEALYSHPLKR